MELEAAEGGSELEREVELEEKAARRRKGSGGVGGDNGEVLVGARSDGCRRGGGDGDNGWTPSPAFSEQPREMEETLFFSQMTARVCGGGVPSPLIEPIMGREGKGLT